MSDPEARKLGNEARQAIADYMGVLEQKVLLWLSIFHCINFAFFFFQTGKVTKLRLPLHPSLRHIYEEILVPRFEEYVRLHLHFSLTNLTDGGTQVIPEHGLFDSEESGNKVLDMLPQGLDDVKQRVRQTWAKEKDQKPLWKWHVVRRIS